MGKRIPIVPSPEMNQEMLEAVAFSRRPRMHLDPVQAARVTRELATDPVARRRFVEAPGAFLADRGLPVASQSSLSRGDGLQLTSEACTAVAVCNAAFLLNVYAVENVVQVQKAVNVQLAVNVETAYHYCIAQTRGCTPPQVHNLASGLEGGAWV